MLDNKTKELQSRMAAYCRDGESVDLPVDSDFRLHQYRRLVFNVVKGTLSQAFPIAARHLGKEQWDQLVRTFFQNHNCQHPQVWRMPQELLEFVEADKFGQSANSPYLKDLLRMEWLEIEVHSMPDRKIPAFQATKDYVDTPLLLDPHHVIERFHYPVHKIHQMDRGTEPGNWFLLIFRHFESGKVHFIQLQPIFALIIQSMAQNPDATAREVYEAICESHEQRVDINVLQSLQQVLTELAARDFVRGAICN